MGRDIFRRKCSCVDDKTFVLLHTGLTIFPVSCLKSVSQRDTAISSQKKPKSVLDTDDPYHVACLRYTNLTQLVVLDVACGKPARRRYCMHECKIQSAPTTTVSCISSWHAYSYIQQSGRSIKTMNAKNTQKSPIHENADANITCDLGVGCHTHGHIVSSIIVR